MWPPSPQATHLIIPHAPCITALDIPLTRDHPSNKIRVSSPNGGLKGPKTRPKLLNAYLNTYLPSEKCTYVLLRSIR